MLKTRVLIVDDHALLRAGLRMLLSAQADMEVVGDSANVREAHELIEKLQPDVVTLDLGLPGGGSVLLIQKLRRELPQIRILVLTMHDDPAYLRTVMAAGAFGFLVKTAADTELLNAIRAIKDGRIYVDVKLAEVCKASALGSPDNGGQKPTVDLSPREQEVLHGLVLGHTNQEIAERLHLSVKTVETYRARIVHKLGLRSRAEMVRYGIEMGILKEGPALP